MLICGSSPLLQLKDERQIAGMLAYFFIHNIRKKGHSKFVNFSLPHKSIPHIYKCNLTGITIITHYWFRCQGLI